MYSRALAFFRCPVVIVHTRLLCAFYNKRMNELTISAINYSGQESELGCIVNLADLPTTAQFITLWAPTFLELSR